MEMNNPSVESHVAQKNRRHKLRFQQISGDLNHHHHHHHQQQDHDPHFLYNNPNVLPSIARNHNNPQLLLPSCYLSHDHQDSSNPERMNMMSSNDGVYGNLASYTQDCSSNWRTVVSSQQEAAGDHWNNAVSYSNAVPMNIDQRSISSSYGYHQETHNFNPSPFYHNNLQQDHVTLALPPHSKNHSGINPSIPCWMNNSDEQENNNTQGGLSLSLSSVPQLKDDQSGFKSDLLPNSDPKSLMGIAAFGHRNTGPLGPFTGYATILKNSKYIKPAQELLNVSCEVGYHTSCHDAYSHKILEEEISMASNSPVGSYGESDEHVSGRIGSGAESIRPGFHRKKAKLLYMQEEVCKRYKQYLQQMQMVISSFETVAGLSGATPYVCLALKAVSRHFHHVKNVISEQLSQMRKAVGEGLCSSSNVSKTFDANATSNSRQKSGGGGGSAGFFVPQQPVWRPQRGLPERAIAVLKTWLFDHFLHPYPSDADKHMLATQTGLTRNQVSNWFINARVRIWKPMVEEIHTLETKNLAEANSSHPQSDGDPNWNMDMNSMSNTQPPECSRNPGTVNVNLACVDEPHDHEKQARVEYQNNIPLSGMDRIMSIMPYPRATFDATGLGPVSLTLGLRQNAEHVQQLQQHFGGQLIHDFVG